MAGVRSAGQLASRQMLLNITHQCEIQLTGTPQPRRQKMWPKCSGNIRRFPSAEAALDLLIRPSLQSRDIRRFQQRGFQSEPSAGFRRKCDCGYKAHWAGLGHLHNSEILAAMWPQFTSRPEIHHDCRRMANENRWRDLQRVKFKSILMFA